MTFISHAQQGDVKARKNYLHTAYWLNLRYDHYLKSGSFLYFENSSRYTNGDIQLGHKFPFNNMYQMYFLGGYEHKTTDHWYLGLSEKFVLEPNKNSSYSRINISHRGKIFGIRFIKEAAFEYLKEPKISGPNYGRVSLLPCLIKDFRVAKKKCYALVSYRAYVIFDFANDGNPLYKNRTIDKTELRVELDCFVTQRLLVSLFAIRDTDYFYALGIFDANNNPIVPPGPLNNVTPTFGIGLNYVFKAPDDYIPSFPIK